MNGIKYYEKVALSNKDILKLLDGKVNIVVYPNLYKYNSIDEVLGEYGACILLFEARPNYGHWVCIFKIDHNTLEFFNPYGGLPDDSLKYIPKQFRLKSHQNIPILSLLMINSPYELTYNEFKFQKKNGDIRTCGRHCVVRLLFRYLDLYKYVKFLDILCQKFNLDYDKIVTLLTI
jgi:hypothetical protein